jgi:serine/threonine protein kinase
MSTPFDHEQTIPEGEHPLLAGRYRVVRRLGAGGMGEVHLVEDLKLDGRHFAVKLLPAFLAANKRAIAGLKREALHAMNLSHSHIVTVRGFEEMDTGQPFLVMDYVDGQTLEEILLERERMSEAEVARIFGPIAEALDYAHGRGVIHRDVKPSNIMIRQDGTPLIMDFGIAREAKETSTLVTGRESTSGTLPYMSPEQLRGKKPEASQDIYSLAATMWECLAGEPPFSRGDLRHQIETVEPDPPSELDGLDWTEQLLLGLSKDGEHRPESCGELVGLDEPIPTVRREAGITSVSESSAFKPRSAADLADLESQVRILAADAKAALENGEPMPPEVVQKFARAGHFVESAKENKSARLWSDAALVLERAVGLYEEIREARGVSKRLLSAREAMANADRRLGHSERSDIEVANSPQSQEYASSRQTLERQLASAEELCDWVGAAKAMEEIVVRSLKHCAWIQSVKMERTEAMLLSPAIKKIDLELISLRKVVQLDRDPKMVSYRSKRLDLNEQLAVHSDSHNWDEAKVTVGLIHRLVSKHRDWYLSVAKARQAVNRRQAKIEWADIRLSGLASDVSINLEQYEDSRDDLDKMLEAQMKSDDWIAARTTIEAMSRLVSKALEAVGEGSKAQEAVRKIRDKVDQLDAQRLKMAASLAFDPRFDPGIAEALARQAKMDEIATRHLTSKDWVDAQRLTTRLLECARDSHQLVERKYQVLSDLRKADGMRPLQNLVRADALLSKKSPMPELFHDPRVETETRLTGDRFVMAVCFLVLIVMIFLLVLFLTPT